MEVMLLWLEISNGDTLWRWQAPRLTRHRAPSGASRRRKRQLIRLLQSR